MKKILFALFSIFSTLQVANAAILTFQYSGIVSNTYFYDQIETHNDFAVANDSIIVKGNHVEGIFTYDDSAPIWKVGRRGENYYLGEGVISVAVVENSFAFASDPSGPAQYSAGNDIKYVPGQFDFFGTSSYSPTPFPEIFVTLSFFDSTATVFDSGAIPKNLELNRFSDSNLVLTFLRGEIESQFTADITSLKLVTSVPEPSSALLLLLGFGFLIYSTKLLPRS